MCCIDIALVWPYCLLVVGNHRWSFLWLIFIGCPISLQPHWSDHHLAGSAQGLAPDEPACPSQFCASPATTYHEPSQWCVSVDFVKFSFYISGSAWNALCNFQQWMAIISVLPLHNVHSVFFSTCIFCVFTYVKQNNKKKKKKKIIPNKSGTVWFLPVTTWCTSGLSIQLEFALGEGRLRQNVTRPVWHVWELWLNSYFCTCTHCVMSFKAMWEYSRESVHWNHSKRVLPLACCTWPPPLI